MRISTGIVSVALALSIAAAMPVAAQSGAEARLRDQLRQTTLDLRAAQDENGELKQKLSVLSEQRQSAAAVATPPLADLAKSRRAEAALNAESAETAALQKQLDEARSALDQWQQSYTQAVTLAKARETDARKFEADAQALGEYTQRCDRDNTQLLTISRELLARYKNKSVLNALGDAEPLTGLQRVQLEKIAQDYHGRIVDATLAAPMPTPASRQ